MVTTAASLVFLDVSGFTRLSERLAARGPDGAEELTGLLDEVLGSQADAVSAFGGRIASFGGDALLAVFEGDGHQRRAVAAAATARDAMASFRDVATSAGRTTLRVSIGVESGVVREVSVGEPALSVVCGPTCTEVLGLEQRAAAGSVLLGPRVAEDLFGRSSPEGVRLISRLLARMDPPAPVRRRHRSGTSSWEPQRRRAVVGFLRLTGTDALSEEQAQADLDHDLRLVQRECERHSVALWATDVDRDGIKVVLAAGAPLTRGDNGDRMLSTLTEVVGATRLGSAAGVHAGRVFMAEVGRGVGARTVVGDTVNVAARLAYVGDLGGVTLTQEILEGCRQEWRHDKAGTIEVRGRRGGLGTARLLRGPPLPRVGEELVVGRKPEITAVLDSIAGPEPTDSGRVQVVGPAGIGKTTLLEAVLRRFAAENPRTRVLRIHGTTYARPSPYLALRAPLRSLLTDRVEDEAACARALRRKARTGAPELLPWLPLVGDVWRTDVPSTPEADAIEPRFRREQAVSRAVDMLRLILPAGSLIAVEDTHWLDDGSKAFLDRVARTGDWRIVTTSRPDDRTSDTATPQDTALELGPLSRAEARTAVRVYAPGLPPAVADAVVGKAGGNPLFLRELAWAARDGLADLPDNLDTLFVAQVDALPTDQARLLRRVAALGARAPIPLARALEDGSTIEQLAGLVDVIEDHVVFHHDLLREAAYGTLPRRERTRLHQTIARELAAMGTGVEDDERVDLLARHHHAAGDLAESWEWSHEAARRARATGSTTQTWEHLSRALEAAQRLGNIPAQELRGALVEASDTADTLGDLDAALGMLRRARRLPQAPVDRAELLRRTGELMHAYVSGCRARAWFNRATNLIKDSADPAAVVLRAQLLVDDAVYLVNRGRFATGEAAAAEAYEKAVAEDQHQLATRAANIVAWALRDAGDRAAARPWFERAIRHGAQVPLSRTYGSALNNAGVAAYYEGDWDRSAELYRRAAEAMLAAGDQVTAAMSEANIAEILSAQGDLDAAEEILIRTRGIFDDARLAEVSAVAGVNLGRVAVRRGDAARARDLYVDGAEIFRGMGRSVTLHEVSVRKVELDALLGDAAEAVDQAETIRLDGAGIPYDRADAELFRAIALLRLGRHTDAIETLENLLPLATENEFGLLEGQARIVLHLARGPDGHDESGARILAGLGIHRWDHLIDPIGLLRAALAETRRNSP